MSLKTSIIVNMAGNLERKSKLYTRAVGGMAKNSRRHLAGMRSDAHKTGAKMGMMGRWIGAAAIGGAAIASGRQVVGLERRFTRLGIQANRASDEMNSLKASIFETANAPDIRADPAEITSAIEAIVEKTGDLDFARENIHNIGAVIQATGAAGASVGEILAEFQKMDIKDPSQVLKAIDILNVQGKEGALLWPTWPTSARAWSRLTPQWGVLARAPCARWVPPCR